MLANWLIAAVVLAHADSWAALMVIVSGYHIVGYMAAPISMGALEPGRRYFGAVVFALLGVLMITITSSSLLLVCTSLSVLICIYASLHIASIGIKKLSVLVLPFIIYLWLLYFIQYIWVVIVFSVAFYFLISSKTYVKFCRVYNKL